MAKGNRFLGICTTLLVPETKRITLEDLTVKDAFLNLCADVQGIWPTYLLVKVMLRTELA